MIWDEVLSFYREPIPRGSPQLEYLRQHVDKALYFIEGVESSRVHRLAKIYSPEIDFKELLRLAIVLHDSGKAFLQTNLKEDKERGIRYLSFAGHEYISATITQDLVFNLNARQDAPFYDLLTFAVLHHHHAMSRPTNLVRVLRERLQSMPQSEYQECLNKLESLLSRFLSDYGDLIKETLKGLRGSPTKLLDDTVYQKIYERLVHMRKPVHKKLAFLLLDSLIACDYLAAQHRGGGGTHFHRAVDEFYRQWLRP